MIKFLCWTRWHQKWHQMTPTKTDKKSVRTYDAKWHRIEWPRMWSRSYVALMRAKTETVKFQVARMWNRSYMTPSDTEKYCDTKRHMWAPNDTKKWQEYQTDPKLILSDTDDSQRPAVDTPHTIGDCSRFDSLTRLWKVSSVEPLWLFLILIYCHFSAHFIYLFICYFLSFTHAYSLHYLFSSIASTYSFINLSVYSYIRTVNEGIVNWM